LPNALIRDVTGDFTPLYLTSFPLVLGGAIARPNQRAKAGSVVG
jgi:hypothetical protein